MQYPRPSGNSPRRHWWPLPLLIVGILAIIAVVIIAVFSSGGPSGTPETGAVAARTPITEEGYRYVVGVGAFRKVTELGRFSTRPGTHYLVASVTLSNGEPDRSAPFPVCGAGCSSLFQIGLAPVTFAKSPDQVELALDPNANACLPLVGEQYDRGLAPSVTFRGRTDDTCIIHAHLRPSESQSIEPGQQIPAGQSLELQLVATVDDSTQFSIATAWVQPDGNGTTYIKVDTTS